jgi:hypothetical protein
VILNEYLENFARRILQDALNEAVSSYWLRRAESFESAKPRLDDYHGTATNADLSAQWRRADQTAKACRHRAMLSLYHDEFPEDVEAALREEGSWQDVPTRLAS